MSNLIDSDGDLLFVITPADVACAIPKDPSACAIAQAIRRTIGTPRVEVHRTVVRVDLPSQDGALVPTRFRLRKDVSALIDHFDHTGEFPPGALCLYHTANTAYSLESGRRYKEEIRSGVRKSSRPSPKRRSEPDPDVRQFDRAKSYW